MSHNNVISFDQTAGGSRRRITDAKAKVLVKACRDQFLYIVPRLLQDLFENLDDELYELADKSASDVLQTRYFDAMRELRKLRSSIEQTCVNTQLAAFDLFWKQPLQQTGGTPADVNELKLIPDDDLEEDLAVNSMTSKAENRFHRELFALNKRFALVAGVSEVSDLENPLAPAGLARAFREALDLWKGEIAVKLVVYKLFDLHVMAYIAGLYDDLNELLIAADVLPKIAQQVRRNPVAPSVKRARDPQAKDQNKTAPDAGSVGQTEILTVLSDLLSMHRGQGGSNFLGLPGGNAADSSLPEVGSQDLLGALSSLQRQAMVSAPITASEIQQSQADMVASLGRQLNMGSTDAPSRRLGSVDQDVLDVMAMLFEFILDDGNVPDAMKALLGRLQIPMLKVVVMDRSFFSNRHHPARRLLNQLARAAMGWVDDGDRTENSLYGHIESVVTRILTDFTDDQSLFEAMNEEFGDYINREARGAEVAEERINQLTRGQDQLRVARQQVADVISEHVDGNDKLPAVVQEFMQEGWRDVMLLAILREGAESPVWTDACNVVKQLIWSVKPKKSQKDRQLLLSTIPALLKEMRKGLNNISFDQHRAARLFKALQVCHIASLRGENNPGVSSKKAEGPVAAEPAKKTTTEGAREVVLSAAQEVVISSESVVEMQDDEFQKRALALDVGNWFEWRDGGKVLRGKLSWRSEATDRCVFVNRKGMKVAEMTVADIAALLRSDSGRVLEDVNKPLMDRALTAMLDALRKTGDRVKPSPA